MKKNICRALAFAGSLLLAAACSSTALAFTGWVEEDDGTMIYLDKSGQRVTDTWMKRGNAMCYLDENGVVAKNQFVEYKGDDCYVDDTGALAKNQWVSRLNVDEECDHETDILWYYFDKNGKMAKYDDSKPGKKWHIDARPKAAGSYFFDSDGHMLSGWQEITENDGNVNTYYLGEDDDGRIRTEWQLMEPREDIEPDNPDHSYDDKVWYYFQWDGIQIKDQEKKINKYYYQFDSNGVMMTGWYPGINPQNLAGSDDEPFAINKYYSKDTGARLEDCWVYAYQQDDYDESGEQYWYYLGKKGAVFNEDGMDADKYLEGAQIAIKHIGNAYYGFDNLGRMITGLIDTRIDERSEENEELMEDEFIDLVGGVASTTKDFEDGGVFYFENQNPDRLGQMRTGKVKLEAISGMVEYYFRDNGKAYTSRIVDNKVYGPDGRLVKGDGQTELIRLAAEIYSKSADKNGEDTEPLIGYSEPFIVSSSGKIKRSGRVTIEGTKYQVENYIATELPD